MYAPAGHVLTFTNRDTLVARFPPLPTGLIMRFFLQLRNVTYTWSGTINAQYWVLARDGCAREKATGS
jgi:hypothetical protein